MRGINALGQASLLFLHTAGPATVTTTHPCGCLHYGDGATTLRTPSDELRCRRDGKIACLGNKVAAVMRILHSQQARAGLLERRECHGRAAAPLTSRHQNSRISSYNLPTCINPESSKSQLKTLTTLLNPQLGTPAAMQRGTRRAVACTSARRCRTWLRGKRNYAGRGRRA